MSAMQLFTPVGRHSAGPTVRRYWSFMLVLGLLCSAPHLTALAQSAPARGQPVTLNFSNADIESVAHTMAVITGRNVVLDPRAKGAITMHSERPITPAQAINQFAAALRLQGFALVDADGMYKVVPEADAKLQARMRGRGVVGSQVVTQVFKLRHENANTLLPALRPLISPNNTINASNNQTLVVTDYADNLQRIARLIANMDQPPAHDMEVIPLRYGIAADIAPLVQKLINASSGSGGPMPGQPAIPAATASGIVILPETRSNALIVRAPTSAQATLARNLILKLDQPALLSGNGDSGNIWVVHLKNADAVKIAATLRAAMAANQVNTGGAPGVSVNVGNPGQSGNAAQVQVTATSALQNSGGPSTGGPIQADPSTNSLVITASEPEYRQLRAVIDRLDTRRAQVYVESLIAEVSADKAADLGVQWQSPFTRGSRVGILGTNFGSTGNIIGMSAGLADNNLPTPKPGINLAALATFRGQPILGFVANFLQSTGDANILSTPNLVTLDNEEARIMIGQNVPFVTGQYTNNNSANGAVNPFQTIERKDVGITLRVKPQISESGTVRMQIYQEVSSVDPASITSAAGLITNKRSIESNVVVDDSQIIVLGGLLSDEYANSQDKVPLLGDIPLLGNLFKSENRSRKKRNLMVFLRPVIVRDTRDAESLSLDRYDMMRASQLNAQPEPGIIKPYEAPALPQVRHPETVWTPVSNPGRVMPAPLIQQPVLDAPYRARQTEPVAEPIAPQSHNAQPPVLQSDHGVAWNPPEASPPAHHAVAGQHTQPASLAAATMPAEDASAGETS